MKIYETVIYDGALKVWRVWNITTATVYSNSHKTEKEAYASIEDGATRGGNTVIRVQRHEILQLLEDRKTE